MALFRRRTRSDARPLAGGTRADGLGAGWVNATSGQGSELDRQVWTGFSSGCDLDPHQIDELTKANAVARRLVRRPVEDSMRAGYFVRGTVSGQPIDVLVGGPEVEKEEAPDPIEAWAKRFGVLGLVTEADSQARAHGLSLWVYGVEDGRNSSEPLDVGSVRALHWVRVISREWVWVHEWDLDPASPRFERPKSYRVTFVRSGITAVYHWSRVQQWTGVDLSESQRARENSGDDGGGSVFDLVWDALKGYGVSHQQALAALDLLTQGVWSNDNLQRAIDSGNATEVKSHYESQRLGGGIFGDYVVGAGESYSIVGRPVQGISDLMERMRDAIVVASGMSEPVILGSAPSSSGLNNDTGGLIRAWYDSLQIEQPLKFGTPLTRFYSIASRAMNGPTGGVPILDLAIGWPRLWQLTAVEQAGVRKSDAESRAVDLGAQVVTLAEARTDKTLIDEYTLAPESVIAAAEPEVAIEEIDVADDEDMPRGEEPLSLTQARAIIGAKGNGTVRGFVARHGVPLFKIPAGFRVFESHLRAAMRESRV